MVDETKRGEEALGVQRQIEVSMHVLALGKRAKENVSYKYLPKYHPFGWGPFHLMKIS